MRQGCLAARAPLLGRALLVLGSIALTVWSAPSVLAADEEPRRLTPNDSAIVESMFGTRLDASASAPTFDVLGAPGIVRSQGANAQPTGFLNLETYLLEEVPIPAGANFSLPGTRTMPAKVLRLTVTGGPFRVGAMSPVVWIGDAPLRFTSLDLTQTRLSALVTDLAVLVNGAPIAVTYGMAPTPDDRLSETLTVPPGLR